MRKLFKIAFHTLRNHGPKMVLTRFYNFNVVKFKRLISKPDVENIKRWANLKGRFEGQRVFVIGNGPSLNKTPLYLLKNEYTAGFNRFNLMFERNGWIPKFYMITDDLVVRDMAKDVNNDVLPYVEYGIFPDIHPSNINFQKYINKRENVLWIKTDNPGFNTELPKCGINYTVVNACLQVMAYFGFKEIYLLGVDASISFTAHKSDTTNTRDLTSKEDDPNHFDPRYFGKGRKFHYQPMSEIVDKFKDAKVFLEGLGIKIVNAGVNGQLEVFTRESLESVLNYSDEQKEKLFLEAINDDNKPQTYREYISDAVILKSADDFTPEMAKAVASFEEGVKLVPKAVFTHIAYGPYNNQYVFVKRKVALSK